MSSFIGFDALDAFSYQTENNLRCPFCSNHCNRTRVTFSNGASWVTGNRCPRGEVVGDPKDDAVRERVAAVRKRVAAVPNLFEEREKLLFKSYSVKPVRDLGDAAPTIGLPRVLLHGNGRHFGQRLFVLRDIA